MHIIRLFLTNIFVVLFGTATLAAQTTIPGSEEPGRLSGISVRAFSGNGDQVLIAGFALNGTTTRPFLVRAIGPGLAPFGVTNYMLDPELKLFRTASETITNELWDGNAELVAIQKRLGAFDLDPSSRDAAVYLPLAPGSYTAHALGFNGSTGEVLLEVYDASENPQFGSSISAVSLRGELGSQTPLMIGGFYISDGAPKQVLIRAIGPTLAGFGVGGALGNPRIRLVQNGSVIQENDDWSTGNDVAVLQQAFADSGAFDLVPGTQDAAMVVTLPPGAYTAHIDDPTGGTGVVLAEVYDLEPPTPTAIPVNPIPSGTMPGVSIIALTSEVFEGKTPGARLMVVRSGDLSTPLSVRLNTSGTAAAADFTSLPDIVILPAGSATKSFTIGAWNDGVFESPEILTVSIQPDPGYTVQGSGLAHVVVRDGANDSGTGWYAEYFNNTSLSGTPALVRTDSSINFNWEGNSPGAGVNANNFTSRWTGLLQVDTTDDYTFATRTDDGVRLYVDDVLIINEWDGYAGEQDATVHLSGGARYSIRMEHREGGGSARADLYWQTSTNGREIIPGTKVHQTGGTTPIITSPRDVVGLVGGPFQYQIAATASPRNFGASGVPAGLTFDSFTGTISGTPTTAGTYQIVLSSSNDEGTGSELLTLYVVSAGAPPDSESWTSAGSTLSAPETPANNLAPLTSFDTSVSSGTALQRVRGYIIPPQTGKYRFWLAAGGPAKLSIADSDQPADIYKRANVVTSSGVRSWYNEPNQQSRMMLMEAGKRYFFEAIQRPTGGSGHMSLSWSLPGTSENAPTEIVPQYCLSKYTPSGATVDGDTLYLAKVRPISDVISPASGTITILFDEETLTGSVSMSFSGLTSPATATYLYAGPQGQTGPLIQALPNGQFKNFNWTLADSGGLTVQDLADALRDGLIYVVIHTENFPEGELRGQLGLSAGSVKFTAPSAPPPVSTGTLDATAAGRFLTQATFGPTQASIQQLQQTGINTWLNQQFNLAPTYARSQMETLEAIRELQDSSVRMDDFQEIWWDRAIRGNDQLRQRVAFALSEILVVSDSNSALGSFPTGMTIYYDDLLRHAFGNFRDLIEDVTLSPIMANYLSMLRNQPPDPARGIYPDENYAREVMQLFTIGLNKLHPDGTLVLDNTGLPIPTYSQEAIVGLAHAFTGWSFHHESGEENFRWGPSDYSNPMMNYDDFHYKGEKRLLESMILDADGTGPSDMTAILDMLFEHDNVGPFISHQLIQRLVTSNPSPGYVYRVAQKFNDNGSGVRGDLKEVVRAILTDYEARSPEATTAQGYGKIREPLLRMTHLWRAFDASAPNGKFSYHRPESNLRQAALRAPTVFNFFEPGFVHPGILAQAGLVAPEFQITNENNATFLTNEFRRAVFSGISYDDRRITLDLTQAETLINQNIGSLVDWLDLVFLNNTLDPAMRTEIIHAVEDLDFPSEFEGSRTAINLIMGSPQYATQK